MVASSPSLLLTESYKITTHLNVQRILMEMLSYE